MCGCTVSVTCKAKNVDFVVTLFTVNLNKTWKSLNSLDVVFSRNRDTYSYKALYFKKDTGLFSRVGLGLHGKVLVVGEIQGWLL